MITTAIIGVCFKQKRDVLAADEDLFADGHAVEEWLRGVRDLVFGWEGTVVIREVHWTLEDDFDSRSSHGEFSCSNSRLVEVEVSGCCD